MPYLSEEIGLSSAEKGSILAAFSTGYMLTQVIGGTASDIFGGKLLTLFAITVMSLGSLAAGPLLSAGGLQLFWCCYFFMGLAEGPSYPTTGSMLSKWIPAHERGAAMSIVDTGSSVASMLTFAVAPLLASRYGWRFAFHCFGGVSLAICALWASTAANRPSESHRLSPEERVYLREGGLPHEDVYGFGDPKHRRAENSSGRRQEPLLVDPVTVENNYSDSSTVSKTVVDVTELLTTQSPSPSANQRVKTTTTGFTSKETISGITTTTTTTNGGSSTTLTNSATTGSATTTTILHHHEEALPKKVVKTASADLDDTERKPKTSTFPFRMFLYAGAWAVVFAHAAFNFGRYFVYNSIVSFYVEVTGVSPVMAGQQVLLGQIADTLGKFLFAGAIDRAIKRDPTAKTRVRKIVSGTAFLVFAASMLIMAHTTHVATVTFALIIAKIASSAHVCGFKTTYLDLSSKHTGSLTGVSNTLATLSAMISPLITGFFLGANTDHSLTGWRHMFFLISFVNVIAAAVWGVFASADSLDDKIAIKGAA